jgi:hypothetical protein
MSVPSPSALHPSLGAGCWWAGAPPATSGAVGRLALALAAAAALSGWWAAAAFRYAARSSAALQPGSTPSSSYSVAGGEGRRGVGRVPHAVLAAMAVAGRAPSPGVPGAAEPGRGGGGLLLVGVELPAALRPTSWQLANANGRPLAEGTATRRVPAQRLLMEPEKQTVRSFAAGWPPTADSEHDVQAVLSQWSSFESLSVIPASIRPQSRIRRNVTASFHVL